MKSLKSSTKEIKNQLTGVDTVSKRNGIFTVRKEFYYRHGMNSETLIDKIKKVFPDVIIIDSGEIWKPFRGGASVANSSHWFVKFSFPNGK